MAIERMNGSNCTVTIAEGSGSATTVAHWSKYSIEKTLETSEASSATSTYSQIVEKKKAAKVTVEGWRGGDDTFMDTIDIGDTVTVAGTNFPSLSAYGTAKVTSKKIDQSQDPGTWSLEITYGFMSLTA